MNTIIFFSSLLAFVAAAPQYNYPSPTTPAPPPARLYNIPSQPSAAAPVPSYTAPAADIYGTRAAPVAILKDEREGPAADGTYSFNFESADGISRYEQGYPLGPDGGVGQEGGWSFTFPDGTPAVVSFVADGQGFRVESDLLPVGPPMPEHALAQIEKARLEDAAVASSNRYAAPPAPAPTGAPAPVRQYAVPTAAPPAPVRQYSAPTVAPFAPVRQYAAPTAAPRAPIRQYAAPTTAPPAPVRQYAAPTVAPSAPVRQYAAPTAAPRAPVRQYAAPTVAPLAPVRQYAAPTAAPAPAPQYSAPIPARVPVNQYSAPTRQYAAPTSAPAPVQQYGVPEPAPTPAPRYSLPTTARTPVFPVRQYSAPTPAPAPAPVYRTPQRTYGFPQ